MFSVTELNDHFNTESAIHIAYGDSANSTGSYVPALSHICLCVSVCVYVCRIQSPCSDTWLVCAVVRLRTGTRTQERASAASADTDPDPPSASHHTALHFTQTEMIPTHGLSSKQVESLIQAKVTHGLTLPRQVPMNNNDRHLPISVVEARKYVAYQDDAF